MSLFMLDYFIHVGYLLSFISELITDYSDAEVAVVLTSNSHMVSSTPHTSQARADFLGRLHFSPMMTDLP